MIRAIIWKEIREQGLIGLTLVVLGTGVLAVTAAFADPPAPGASPTEVVKFLGLGQLATLMLAVTAGIVCGGAVFAAEREAGTFSFLDSLPGNRWSLWQAKLLAGLGLALVQIVLLIGIAASLGLVTRPDRGAAIGLYSLLAFAWGVFGSTSARTTLGSIGIAIPTAILTSVIILAGVVLLFQNPTAPQMPRPTGTFAFLTCMFLIPLGLSAWLFTGQDRLRMNDATGFAPSPMFGSRTATGNQPLVVPPRPSRRGIAAVAWLWMRQLLIPGVVLSAFALMFGLTLLAPTVQPFLAWPALALAAGVLAGVTAFGDEQTRGAARFWGEQRLPIGRVWLIKIGLQLLLCMWLLVLLALPLLIRSQIGEFKSITRGLTVAATVFRAPLFDELGSQGWKYLLVPAVYGFAAGHICGLLFRKLVVACGVAGIVGGVGAAAWGPSLLAGGVKNWQLWLPPITALLTAFFLFRSWVSERIGTRSSLTTLAFGCLATALLMAAGIGYRVVEIPDQPEGEDDLKFVAGLMPFEENLGGRDFKTAAERYNRLAITLSGAPPERPERIPGSLRRERIEDRMEQFLRFGWGLKETRDREFANWLNAMFSDTASPPDDVPWHVSAMAAANRPIGIYEYPQFVAISGFTSNSWDNARRMGCALLTRGLQRQAEGDPTEFPRRFWAAMQLARTLRNGSIVSGYIAGADVERAALSAFDHWLGALPQRSEHLRPAIAMISALEPTAPFDPTPYFLAERHVLREAMKAPTQWLPALITPTGGNPEATATEVDLVGLAWAVPWERERTRRVIGLGFESGLPRNATVVVGRPGVGLLIGRARHPGDFLEVERLLTTHRRAAMLKIALRVYRSETGAYPERLDQLVPTCLPRLPADPFDEQRTLGYRLSKPPGDVLIGASRAGPERTASPDPQIGPPPERKVVPAGQAILWSVGPDRVDQKGQNYPVNVLFGLIRPSDLVYLVPHEADS